MRRSKAPSVINKTKHFFNPNDPEDKHYSFESEEEQYDWGSRNNKNKLKRNRYENQRIFNVVWREVSTKKHKTWKGDGTLEVNDLILKASLKDEIGKYIGSSTKFNRKDLRPDYHMVIGNKEIEIQSEILDENQLHELRKRQVENLNHYEEEWVPYEEMYEEKRKHKGGFKFKPNLVLNPPKVTSDVKKKLEEPNICLLNIKTPGRLMPLNSGLCMELICFLRPSDLQQFLFQKVLAYISSNKSSLTLNEIQSLHIPQVLQHICNHPSLINYESTTNKFLLNLIPALPDWTEMGPFDSSKLEFVQYFLTDLKKINRQSCTIIAKNFKVLNMLQGLCDFLNIKCLRLTTNTSENFEKEFIVDFFSSENTTQVLLINSTNILSSLEFFTYCKKLIVFEEVSENMNNLRKLDNLGNITIYNLVTAFSIEELLLLDTYNNDNLENLFNELANMRNSEDDCCYLHSKIQCNCFMSCEESTNANNKFEKNWKHFKNPYGVQLLQISSLENLSENIVSIFCRKNNLLFSTC